MKTTLKKYVPTVYFEVDDKEKNTDGTVKFDIFSFVINSMGTLERLEEFEEGMLSSLKDNYAKETIESIKENLLVSKIRMWKEHYANEPVLPIYWFDMMYNILKRTKRNLQKYNPVKIEKEDLYTYIGHVYKEISRQLKKQQDEYQLASVSMGFDLVKKFEDHPYVQYFFDQDQGKQKKRKVFFADLAKELIKGVK